MLTLINTDILPSHFGENFDLFALKMEAERSTETLVSTFKITRRRNSEYRD
jgi:hypothetical protein